MKHTRASFFALALAVVSGGGGRAALAAEPDKDIFRFGVIGDSGSASKEQFRVAEKLAEAHRHWTLDLVIMLGDNIYGDEAPDEYARRFEKPYQALLDAGLPFYAALGNHDHPNQRFYRQFNMEGRRYYSFKGKDASARFFALDTNYMDPDQLDWLKKEACGATEKWKFAFFHHPIYSSGKTHGSSIELRKVLEPIFVECGIDVVFAGHDHFYERVKPQKGILYFVSGGAGKLREGNIDKRTGITEVGFDHGYHCMVVAIRDDAMSFSTLTHDGREIDSGNWRGREGQEAAAESAADGVKEVKQEAEDEKVGAKTGDTE